ncbi:MAG: hypothetical protein K2J31_03160 [Alistipes sp.]|nr:hypothetical protein [Alistipes sp.]
MIFAAFMAMACSSDMTDELNNNNNGKPSEGEIPEGYFVATFGGGTRAADSRVRHLRCIVYNSDTKAYVDEKVVLTPQDAIPSWPLKPVEFTLPNGNYTAVFLGNVASEMFDNQAAELLQNYRDGLDKAEILAPSAGFDSTNMYYWASVDFNQDTPDNTIILQRIVTMQDYARNFVDADQALDQLVENIVTQVGYRSILNDTVKGLLGVELKKIPLLGTVVGGLDAVVGALLDPIVDALYDMLLKQLVHELAVTLVGNEDATQEGLVAHLGVLLNPWAASDAHDAVLNIENRVLSIGLDLKPISVADATTYYACPLIDDSAHSRKYISMTCLAAQLDVTKINVAREGLVGGVVVDNLVEELLMNGMFVDIVDELTYTPEANRRYQYDYSLVDLGLKSYEQQTDGNHSLTLSVRVGDVANVSDLLGKVPLLGTILNLVLTPIENIVLDVPVNLPLLGIDNLSVSGSWSAAQ